MSPLPFSFLSMFLHDLEKGCHWDSQESAPFQTEMRTEKLRNALRASSATRKGEKDFKFILYAQDQVHIAQKILNVNSKTSKVSDKIVSL